MVWRGPVSVAFALALTLSLPPLLRAAAAQPAKTPYRIGLFHVGLDHVPPSQPALRERLSELGYEDGANIRFDWRNVADERAAREVAKEFTRDRVDVIVAFENQSVRAAKAATSEIPIVMLHVTDPVKAGFVESFAHPGGNVTGVAGLADLPGKRLELFAQVLPAMRRVLLLLDPTDVATARQLREVRRAGRILNLELIERPASSEAEIRRVLGDTGPVDEADGVFVVSPNLYLTFSRLIIELALQRQLPTVWHRRFGTELGALVSYGGNLASVGTDAATYVDRILRGARPGDLPVQELARFELVINLKTAKALGLTIPPSAVIRADRLIE